MIISCCAILLATAIQSPQQWRVERVLRIGSVDDPTTALSQVAEVSIGPNGAIYVAQPQDQHIKVFDATGRPIAVLGRPGEGPGEFRDLSTLSWRADSLFASDQRLQRVLVYDTAGRLVDTRVWHSPPVVRPLSRTAPTAVLANGSVMVRMSHGIGTGGTIQAKGVPVLRTDWNGSVLDTLAVFPLRIGVSIPRGTGFFVTADPFMPGEWARVTPRGDRMVLVEQPRVSPDGSEVRVSVFNPDGEQLWSHTIDYPGRRIPGSVSDSVYSAIAAILSGSNRATRSSVRTARDHIQVPEAYPPIETVRVADDGSIWLGHERDGSGLRSWDVLDRNGRQVAIARTPDGLSVRAIQDGAVWGVERDEWDVQYIAKYHIVQARDRRGLIENRSPGKGRSHSR